MELAGKGLKDAILKDFKPSKVLLLVGGRGNGSDALVCGRYLINEGIGVDAFIITQNLSEECQINLNLFKGNVFKKLPLLDYDLIIDGLIGIGLNQNLKENYVDVINKVNASKIKIASIDIPSGINADNGLSYNGFIKADINYSMKYHKVGLFLNDGLDSYKELRLIDLPIIDTDKLININESITFKNILPERRRNSHKSSYGRASIIAGSKKYPGASIISYNALAAFMMGVGFSTLYIPSSLYDLYTLRYPEIILDTLNDNDGSILFDKNKLDEIISKSDSIAIGMGLGVSKELYDTISYLIQNYKGTLIIDADGLNSLSKYGVDIIKRRTCEIILTPHIKEFSRLSGYSVEDIINNQIDKAKEFSKLYNICLILKSASSIICYKDDLSINISGTSALAKGGSGDTLSGILAGICAYTNIDTYTKATLGSYVLGSCAEISEKEEECSRPIDIINNINKVIKNLKCE